MKQLLFIFSMFILSWTAFAQEKAYLVSNAHFDSQWNWDVQRSINEYIPKTLDQNLFLLANYPDYVFNFEGGVKYAWMKEYYPHQYELIKPYIRSGRWHVAGSSWDATDPNIPSPESFSRNILYGQHFYRDEFGVEGSDIFLPDCFGFGWTLPTIAAHSGLIGFSTQKLQWRQRPFYEERKIPFEIGLWQGIDGSQLMMVADAHNYTTKWKLEDLSQSHRLLDIARRSPIHTVYHYYGTGDTGGAPTIESVRALETGIKGQGAVKIISATSDQLYKDYLPFSTHPELPVWNGELLMDVHATGCYTSQAAMKRYNRRNEQLADAAERCAVAADWIGAVKYPKELLTEAWKRVIWHQFHDDLTGTSIPRAYEFSWNDELISLQQFAGVLTTSVGGLARGLDTRVKGTPLIVYNAAAYQTGGIVEVTNPYPHSRSIAVYNDKNQQVASQQLADGTLLIEATAPAVGYAVYDIRQEHARKIDSPLKASGNQIENSIYRIQLDKNGDLKSIVDKRNSRELVKADKAVRLALFTTNESFEWPAWEILKKTIDAEPTAITENVRITVAEQGPVRVALCVDRTYGASHFRQYIRLSEGANADRIDIDNQVDWQTSGALLKAEFALNVSHDKARYDLGIGSIERANNTAIAYEVYAQQWCDLTDRDGTYGVSMLNDCKYGWDKPDDNTVRLTLLHTPSTDKNYSYQNQQDMGKHRFTYSIVGHMGDFRQAATVRKAESLNQSLTAYITSKHEGILGRQFSFLRCEQPHVELRALKQAEKSDEYILRFYETSGEKGEEAHVTCCADILAAQEINGVEDEIGTVNYSGNELRFEIKPFSVKSFRIRLARPYRSLAEAISAPVPIKYTHKAASFNAFRADADFDGTGNSYAAELLPSQITAHGINFQLATPEAENSLICRGDTIILPTGNYNRLYLLAASTRNDCSAAFTIDGKRYEAQIPYYSGFIGQWGHTGHTEAFLKQSDIAFVGTHRHNKQQNKDLPYEYTYLFRIGFDLPKGAQQLILPDMPEIVLFAVTVANDPNCTAKPTSDLLRL